MDWFEQHRTWNSLLKDENTNINGSSKHFGVFFF